MKRMIKKRLEALFVFFIAVMLMHGCLGKQGFGPHEDPSYNKSNPEELQGEIKRLEEIVRKNSDSTDRGMTHLQLALLYSSHNNLFPNYHLALKELEAYVSLNPARGSKAEIRRLVASLREIVRLSEDNEVLKQKIEQLKKENKELKGTIEELKNLDIKIEEKRKKIK